MMLFGGVGCATGNDWLDVCGGPDYISVDQGVFKRNFFYHCGRGNCKNLASISTNNDYSAWWRLVVSELGKGLRSPSASDSLRN